MGARVGTSCRPQAPGLPATAGVHVVGTGVAQSQRVGGAPGDSDGGPACCRHEELNRRSTYEKVKARQTSTKGQLPISCGQAGFRSPVDRLASDLLQTGVKLQEPVQVTATTSPRGLERGLGRKGSGLAGPSLVGGPRYEG